MNMTGKKMIKNYSIAFFIILCPLCIPGWSSPRGDTIDTAVSWQKKKLFFFSKEKYIKYDIKESNTDIGYPRTINKVTWPGLWTGGVDAGVNWGNGKLYFFKGDSYIRYDEKKDAADKGYPKPISGSWPGVWQEGIDAAVNWGNGKVYFFKGNSFIRYNTKTMKPDPGYPKLIADFWPGLWTKNIDSAVNRGNGKVYFFKDNMYIRYNIRSGKADRGYPRTVRSSNWPGIRFRFTHTLENLGKGDVIPHLKPGYSFPVSRQFKHGCFAFAVNHILEYKYKRKLDLVEAEKQINKPRADLWTSAHIQNFTRKYNITLTWYNDTETFFSFLSLGEPLMIQYRWYSSDTHWVGHFVAVYSFDQYGVWVSDSISAHRIHIPYDDFLDSSGDYTMYAYAVIKRGE